ncbi:MAG: lamin tail domain-containing protein [Nanoarchaeota archaeon]|nr:lamin tail domain-containing protein [Nanoarchaeota archaeon]
MKRGLVVLFLIVFLSINIISASVFINEIELNPVGTDSGNEWVEMYNDGSSVNITLWYIQDKNGKNFTIPETVIEEKRFYVFDNFTSQLTNENQSLSLFNEYRILEDSFGLFKDTDNDNKTWQRIPDGTGNFSFKEQTKYFPNQKTLIENKTSSPICILKGENVTLRVQATGFCIEEVIFSVLTSEAWTNFTGVKLGDNYSYVLNTLSINNNQVNWTVYSRDCFNRTEKDGTESFYINNKTQLSAIPSNPDGLNGWYVTEPLFSLINLDATKLYYQWDSTGIFGYVMPFRLENSPNNGNVTGGILELNYWSNLSCKVEPKQSQIFKFDFKNPLIKNLQPANGSNVVNNLKPTIQALLDEVYQSNSGIDKSTVNLLVDGKKADINLFDSGDLDAIVRHNSVSDLSLGWHNVTVNVTDKAGRNSELTWFFNITIQKIFNLSVYSPQNGTYGSRKILFNITTTEDVERIEYKNWNDKKPKFAELCSNCNEYGFSKKKTKTLNEGQNNISIRASDSYGNVNEQNISFFIDSKEPIISKTEPGKNSVTNGSKFYVKYSEDNLQRISVIFNNTEVNLTGCVSGKNKNCSINLDLSGYNGRYIDYQFKIKDSINEVLSKQTRVLVDSTSPILIVNSPANANYTRRVPFNISITEEITLEYYDNSIFNPKWRTLCTRCDKYGDTRLKRISFKSGNHDLLIRAVDEAGNSDIKNILFGAD